MAKARGRGFHDRRHALLVWWVMSKNVSDSVYAMGQPLIADLLSAFYKGSPTTVAVGFLDDGVIHSRVPGRRCHPLKGPRLTHSEPHYDTVGLR
jgi:hypothetical protein